MEPTIHNPSDSIYLTATWAGRQPARPVAAAIEALEPRRMMTTITGVVFADNNDNGVQDAGEPGVPGIEVTYDGSNNTSSASGGGFTLSGAASSGSHHVGITTPSGWTLTEPTGTGTYLNTGSNASLSFGIEFTPNFSAVAVSSSEIDLLWTNSDGALRPELQRSSDGGATWTDLLPTPLYSGNCSYQDTDLALRPGTSYVYKLTEVDSSGDPIASTTQDAATLSSTLATVHDNSLQISAYTLEEIGIVTSGWESASLQTGTTTAGGTVTANDDGSWTYTPPAGWVGDDTLWYTLSNGTTTSAPLPVTLSVTDQAPQVDSTWNFTFNDNPTVSTYAAPSVSGALGATDGDGDAVTFSVVNADGTAATADESGDVATPHGEVSLSSDGDYTYTPAAGFVGIDRFFVVANDGVENSAVASVTISVEAGVPIIALPDISDPDDIGVPWTFSLDAPANTDSSQFEVLSSPSHGTLAVNSNGTLTYTASSYGLDSFTFSYGSDVPPSTVLIDVNTGWDGTWNGIGGATYEVAHGTSVSENVLTGVSYGPGGSLSANLLSAPSSGTLTFSSDGSFTYAPGNTIGWIYLTYDVEADGATSPPATVAFDASDYLCQEWNDPINISTTPGTAVNLDPRTPLVDGTPLDTLTTSIINGPLYGSVTTNSDGTLTYTPNAGFAGIDSFTYQVNGAVADATFGSISQSDNLNSGFSTVYVDVATA